ncbi:MAG TPA: TIGR04282 family arsenosugar biosynthesis glycosyltransferase [Burkholderiales bacterium]
MAQPALIIFAKQPIPGQVKTRLLPDYTAAQAAEIAALFVRETVELAAAHWPGPLYLYGAPTADAPLFHELARRVELVLADQGAGDLGARMRRALEAAIARHGAAAILGCDVPHCDGAILDEANALLAGGANVLGPSEDGGYYLIGLTRPAKELFVQMPWGGARVLAATLERARALGIEFALLRMLRDIDTAADLRLVAQQHASLRRFA